jgi:threonine dehydratase
MPWVFFYLEAAGTAVRTARPGQNGAKRGKWGSLIMCPHRLPQPKTLFSRPMPQTKPAPADSAMRRSTLARYLQRILTARVYDVAIESELGLAPNLSRRMGHQIWLKREDTQPVFSFKLRGAYNKMAHLKPEQRAKGVICASAGNHAQGVALAAGRMGCSAVIVMPTTTPRVKVDAVQALGGEVVLHGESYSDAYAHALELQRSQGRTFVHPFDDPDVIAGQGTVAMEILRQHPGPLDAIFVAIGGGGLISGVAAYIKAVRPEIRIIGVQTQDSDAMRRSVEAGRRITLGEVGLFSDGTAVKTVGEETFRLTRLLVDEILTVSTDEVCAAIKDVFEDTRSILEPAGALGVAAAKQYAQRWDAPARAPRPGKGRSAPQCGAALNLVAITCGANMNFDRLRFVAERAEVGEQREALFAVTIPEEKGSFKRLCELLGPRAVTEFNYRMADSQRAHVFVGLAVGTRQEGVLLAHTLRQAGFETLDITEDELAKTHVRHMVGGPSALAGRERLFRFIFPERPGALMKFLSSMPTDWNISLFHYRNQGADYGRILVGLQVPSGAAKALKAFLTALAYPYEEETANPVYQLFLRTRA